MAKKQDVAPVEFSGIARSVICFDQNGFRNFKIVTLTIEKGIVVKQELSDPYANFETIVRCELLNYYSIHNLNENWQNGKALAK